MRKKRNAIILLICFALFFSVLGARYMQTRPKNFSSVNLLEYNSSYNFYYTNLTKNAKIAYTLILNEIEEFPAEIEVPLLTEEEHGDLFLALSYDHPDILCFANESQMRIQGVRAFFIPNYAMDQTLCKTREKQLHEKVEEIYKNVTPTMSDYEIELFFHDYICKNTVYSDKSEGGYTAYDALLQGHAVCEGYARAMQLLLQRAGIPSYLVTGSSRRPNSDAIEGHMWNVVRIGGQNYYLDVTWDDMNISGFNTVQHTYFNLTEAEIVKDHKNIKPNDNDCTATVYNYFIRNQVYFSQYNTQTKNKIVSLLHDSIRQQTYQIEIRFSDTATYQEALQDLTKNGEILHLLRKAYSSASKKYKKITYSYADEFRTIQFILPEKEIKNG